MTFPINCVLTWKWLASVSTFGALQSGAGLYGLTAFHSMPAMCCFESFPSIPGGLLVILLIIVQACTGMAHGADNAPKKGGKGTVQKAPAPSDPARPAPAAEAQTLLDAVATRG